MFKSYQQFISSVLPMPESGLHWILVPYLSLPCEQLKIRLGESLSLVLSGSEHYASLIPFGVLINKCFAIRHNALAGGLPADYVVMPLQKCICGYFRI